MEKLPTMLKLLPVLKESASKAILGRAAAAISSDVLASFDLHDTLNPQLWQGFKLNQKIRKDLLAIGKDFYKTSITSDKIKLVDIIFAGSNCNFNYSNFSDIDLHVIIDSSNLNIPEDILDDYLKDKTFVWNKSHSIKIYGYDIEIYLQKSDEALASSGIYSILNNKWTTKPSRDKKIVIDLEMAIRKAEDLIREFEYIEKKYEESSIDLAILYKQVKELKEKIRTMRKAGLEENGELSIENCCFKILRRIGFMEKLKDLKEAIYDDMWSLKNNEYSKIKS